MLTPSFSVHCLRRRPWIGAALEPLVHGFVFFFITRDDIMQHQLLRKIALWSRSRVKLPICDASHIARRASACYACSL